MVLFTAFRHARLRFPVLRTVLVEFPAMKLGYVKYYLSAGPTPPGAREISAASKCLVEVRNALKSRTGA